MKIAKRKTLLKILENSVLSPTFIYQNLYLANDEGEVKDILEDGAWSCAVFVSWTLLVLGLIKEGHARVAATLEDMTARGWYEIVDLKPGAVLLWEDKVGTDDGVMHSHIGFYVGGDQAISNNSKGSGDGQRIPWKHHYTYNDTRKIEKIFWHADLDEE